MKKSLFILTFLFSLLFLVGCERRQVNQPAQIICTRLENDVFQFQYDTGAALDMGVFLNYLDVWMKDHPEVTVKSVIPQVTERVFKEGSTEVRKTVTNGVLVFAKIDSAEEQKQNQRRAKDAADKKKAEEEKQK